MAEGAQDPWRARISEHVDGTLEPGERTALEQHLAGCSACRALALDLRELVERARALPEREPARDLWPGIRAEIERARPARAGRSPGWSGLVPRLTALAAGVVLGLGVGWILDRPAQEPVQVARGSAYLLLLHEPPELLAGASAEEIAAVVGRYRSWAQELAARGLLEAGEKLADREGWLLRADGSVAERREPGGIGGFFVLRAEDEQQALSLARTCPHLEQGGWIELRRIEATD
jgi:hypothetical protein